VVGDLWDGLPVMRDPDWIAFALLEILDVDEGEGGKVHFSENSASLTAVSHLVAKFVYLS
jgi:hypothetical protein